MLSPPICSGLDERAIVPETFLREMRVPFTYSERFDPSYVTARCDHVFVASGFDEKARCFPLPMVAAPAALDERSVVASRQ